MAELWNADVWRDATLETLATVGRAALTFGLKLAVALTILAAGWMVGRILQAVTRRATSRLGVDRLLRRAGVDLSLQRAGVTQPLSEMLARLLFWLVMLVFLLMAVDVLGWDAVTKTLERFAAYVPRILGAAVLVFLGLLLGRLTHNLMASGAVFGSPTHAARLAAATNVAIVVTAAVLAVERLGVEVRILASVTTAVVAALGGAMGLAFALGARGVVAHVLAGHFLRQRLQPGQAIEVEGERGVVARVGAVDTLIEGQDGAVSIPNSLLLEQTVRHREP